jgi:heptosyltransferase-1
VYGYDASKIREKPASWMQTSVPFHDEEITITQQCRKIAQAPWLEGDTSQILVPYEAPTIHRVFDEELPEGLSEKSPWVVLNLGGSFATKELPDATWLQLANKLIGDGYQVVWCWGSPKEKEKAKQLSANGVGYVLPSRLAIPALCALFKRSFAVVAADTGILHLASAAGAPTISFWGPTPCYRNAPQGKFDQHVESNPECGPCIQKTCDNFICMDLIKTEALFQCIKNIEKWS